MTLIARRSRNASSSTDFPAAEAFNGLLERGTARITVRGGTLTLTATEHEILIGPWLPEGAAGCVSCAAQWRYDTGGVPAGVGRPLAGRLFHWHEAVEALVSEAVVEPRELRRRVRILALTGGGIATHSFLAHPRCPECAPPPGSRSSATVLELSRVQPTLDGVLRVREMNGPTLHGELGDIRFGPVAHSYRDEESPLALVTSETVVPGFGQREGGYGRSARFTNSAIPACLEGFERVLGGYRMPHTETITGSYRELAADALDPESLGGHDGSAPLDSRHGYTPYTPDVKTSWVWAYSTLQARPVLVPEHVAYWQGTGRNPRFVYESSNGCAVGGSLEEAVLYGMFEVVERDAFLMAWYSRTRLRAIDLTDDADTGHIRDLIAERGLSLTVLDATSDFGIPTAIAVITAEPELVSSGLVPALSLASGTHPDGAKAINAALEESLTNALMYPKWVKMRSSVDIGRCRPMLSNYDLVKTLEDHTGMHGLSEARHLSEFLLAPTGTVASSVFRGEYEAPEDMAEELRLRIATVHSLGLDVLVVDQSAPFLSDAVQVSAAKVIIPGAVPMTFGHHNRRLEGLPRLRRAAKLLKGGVPWSHHGEIRPVPHPFP